MEKIKEQLDQLRSRYNCKEFIEKDPVQFSHRYDRKQDVEIVSFLVATISWGNRQSILKSAEKMLALMGTSPYEFVQSKEYLNLGKANIHRTFFETDLAYYCRGLDALYNKYDSLEELFSADKCLWKGIVNFRNEVVLANNGMESKHISNPLKNSASKRLHMALRWLVRNDGIVDLGLWPSISPSQLFIPIDTHVARISRELGLLKRKSNDRKAVVELTSKLREIDPLDPVSYDFALFGWGENRNFLKE